MIKSFLVDLLVYFHDTVHVPEDDDEPLTSIRNVLFHAELIDGCRASFRMPIRCPPHERERTRKHVAEAVRQGRWHQVSCSEWGAPAFTVDKKDCPEGRQVVDYRLTNKVIRRFHFSIPNMWDILLRVSGAWFISLLDAKSGFRQVEYTPEASRMFTVSTWEGLYRPLRLEMGPANGPEGFQCLMHVIFAPVLWQTVCIFIDDLVAFTHQRTVERALHFRPGPSVSAFVYKALVFNPNGLRVRIKKEGDELAKVFLGHHLILLSETRLGQTQKGYGVALEWLDTLGFTYAYFEGDGAPGQGGILCAVQYPLRIGARTELLTGRLALIDVGPLDVLLGYAPQSGNALPSVKARVKWHELLQREFAIQRERGRPLVFGGDLNVAVEGSTIGKALFKTPHWRREAVPVIAEFLKLTPKEVAGWPSATEWERTVHRDIIRQADLTLLSCISIPTWRGPHGPMVLDYLYGRGVRPVSSYVGDRLGSDHRTLSVRFIVEGDAAVAEAVMSLGDEGKEQPTPLADEGDASTVLRFSSAPLPPRRNWSAKDGRFDKLSPVAKEHFSALNDLFSLALQWRVRFAAKKSSFFQGEGKLLGTMVGRAGCSAESARCKAITLWPLPRTRTEVRQFLGVVGFVRPFCGPRFSEVAKGLHLFNLNTTPKTFDLTEPRNRAGLASFEGLKRLVVDRVQLLRPDYDACRQAQRTDTTPGAFECFLDACDYAAGGAATQLQDAVRAPLFFASTSLTVNQMAWPIGMKELWIVYFCCGKFACMLYGYKTIYWVDHANLLRLERTELSRTNGMLIRWYIYIRTSGGDLRNLQGRSNMLGDGLSRNPPDVEEAKRRLGTLKQGTLEEVGTEMGLTIEEWASYFGLGAGPYGVSSFSSAETAFAVVHAEEQVAGPEGEPVNSTSVVKQLMDTHVDPRVSGPIWVYPVSENPGQMVRREDLLFLPDCSGLLVKAQVELLKERLQGSDNTSVRVLPLEPIYSDTCHRPYWFCAGRGGVRSTRLAALQRQLLASVITVLRTLVTTPCTIVVGWGQGGIITLALTALLKAALAKVQCGDSERRELCSALNGVHTFIAVHPSCSGRTTWDELQSAVPTFKDPAQVAVPAKSCIVLSAHSSVFHEVMQVSKVFPVHVVRVPHARLMPRVPLHWDPEVGTEAVCEYFEEAPVSILPEVGGLRERIRLAQLDDGPLTTLREYMLSGKAGSQKEQNRLRSLARHYRVAPTDEVLERSVGRDLWAPEVPCTPCDLEFPRGEIMDRSLKSTVTSTLRHFILFQTHHSLAGGHRSARELLPLLRRLVYWRGMGLDLHHWCDEICLPCARRRRSGRIGYYQMRSAKGSPFRWVQMDLVGPITPLGDSKYAHVLTYICVFSKYSYFRAIESKDAPCVAQALLDIFFESGVWPYVIQSDNGKEFVNWVMAEVLRLSSICHVRGASYTPRVQGIIESSHRSLGAGLCILLHEFLSRYPTRWVSLLPALQYHARQKPLFGKYTPFQIVHGWSGVSPLESSLFPTGEVLVSPELEETWLSEMVSDLRDIHSWFSALTAENQESIAERHDERIVPVVFRVGEYVVVTKPFASAGLSAKLSLRAIGVATITELSNTGMAATVRYANGVEERKVATSRLIRYPFEPFLTPSATRAEHEVRGIPLAVNEVRGIETGFIVFGVAVRGLEELICVGRVLQNTPAAELVVVAEFRDKGRGPHRARAWRPLFVQGDGRVGFRASEQPVHSEVPYGRVYGAFNELLPNNRLPSDTVEALRDQGVLL